MDHCMLAERPPSLAGDGLSTSCGLQVFGVISEPNRTADLLELSFPWQTVNKQTNQGTTKNIRRWLVPEKENMNHSEETGRTKVHCSH